MLYRAGKHSTHSCLRANAIHHFTVPWAMLDSSFPLENQTAVIKNTFYYL